jgi:hypothetical protein
LTDRDVLVLNNTRVFPARLRGRRWPSGGSIELLLLREVEDKTWQALTRPGRRLRTGAEIEFEDANLRARVIASHDDGLRTIKFQSNEPLETSSIRLANRRCRLTSSGDRENQKVTGSGIRQFTLNSAARLQRRLPDCISLRLF